MIRVEFKNSYHKTKQEDTGDRSKQAAPGFLKKCTTAICLMDSVARSSVEQISPTYEKYLFPKLPLALKLMYIEPLANRVNDKNGRLPNFRRGK